MRLSLLKSNVSLQLWGNIFLSMASLVIAMQLRQIFYQIDARLKRHRNYRRIVAVLDQQYVYILTFLSAASAVRVVFDFVPEYTRRHLSPGVKCAQRLER